LVDRFIEIATDLCENNKVRELIIFTSVEAKGKQAEYVRFGLDYDKFWSNVDKILTNLPKVTINETNIELRKYNPKLSVFRVS
jgi:hypothetical protein